MEDMRAIKDDGEKQQRHAHVVSAGKRKLRLHNRIASRWRARCSIFYI